MCETAIALTYEGDENGALFSDCVRALSGMCTGDEGVALVGFLLNALRGAGYGVTLENCPHCGANLSGAERLRFDLDTGSFSCWDCGTGAGGRQKARLETVEGIPYLQDRRPLSQPV